MIYLAWTWAVIWQLTPGVTARLAKREDPSTAVAELVVVAAGTAMLVAVGFALVRAGQAAGFMKAYLVALGLVSVVLSWIVVHAVYALRYAREYYSEPAGGIDFNEAEPPNYIDFVYFSFTVGMTFQVADTNITTKAVRRMTLHHALLSYVFGAVAARARDQRGGHPAEVTIRGRSQVTGAACARPDATASASAA